MTKGWRDPPHVGKSYQIITYFFPEGFPSHCFRIQLQCVFLILHYRCSSEASGRRHGAREEKNSRPSLNREVSPLCPQELLEQPHPTDLLKWNISLLPCLLVLVVSVSCLVSFLFWFMLRSFFFVFCGFYAVKKSWMSQFWPTHWQRKMEKQYCYLIFFGGGVLNSNVSLTIFVLH